MIRSWARRDERLPELAEFAVQGHGFASDANGLTYPSDLDDFDRERGLHIRPGYVEAYHHYGPPEGQSWLVPEPLYLAVLAEMLDAAGFTADAVRVRARALVAE